MALPHRTQILYMPDIAFITNFLNILPGHTIIEAGTGSGSFSHAVARTIGKQGILHSYEFHEERFQQAQKEFKEHGLEQIRLSHRNVCKNGFDLDDEADAIFLDLPSPWEAIEHAKVTLRKDRPAKICCFSPCIEQVLRTVLSLGANGFQEITMYETLLKTYDTVTLLKPPPTVQEAIQHLKSVESRKERRRQNQIARSKLQKTQEEDRSGTGTPTLLEVEEMDDAGNDPMEEGVMEDPLTEIKDAQTTEKRLQYVKAKTPAKRKILGKRKREAKSPDLDNERLEDGQDQFEPLSLARPLHQLRGHTSYLTFATLMPLENESNEKNDNSVTQELAASKTARSNGVIVEQDDITL